MPTPGISRWNARSRTAYPGFPSSLVGSATGPFECCGFGQRPSGSAAAKPTCTMRGRSTPATPT